MKLAVISDVHADVHALRDALKQIDAMRCDRIVCCGDLIDYGLFPEETLDLLQERGIPTIRGNHDRWAIKDSADLSGWDLTRGSMAYLDGLPSTLRFGFDGLRVVLWHARPQSDMKGIPSDATEGELWELLDEAEADVLIVGHTHVPVTRHLSDGRLFMNPGALLRDPAPGTDVSAPGTFGVLDSLSRKFTVKRAVDGLPYK
ncbi:metallophosphoesterase family protein [soil metagenome]